MQQHLYLEALDMTPKADEASPVALDVIPKAEEKAPVPTA